MDPLSIMAGAAGFVCLLLQVSKSLISYYQSWESQDEEIANTLQHLTEMRDTASVLSDVITSISPHQTVGLSNLERLLSRLEEGQQKLVNILDKCQVHEPPKKLKDRLHHTAKKSVYPLKRDTIRRLNQVISEIRGD